MTNQTYQKLSDPDNWDRDGILTDIQDRLFDAGDDEAYGAIYWLREQLARQSAVVNWHQRKIDHGCVDALCRECDAIVDIQPK